MSNRLLVQFVSQVLDALDQRESDLQNSLQQSTQLSTELAVVKGQAAELEAQLRATQEELMKADEALTKAEFKLARREAAAKATNTASPKSKKATGLKSAK